MNKQTSAKLSTMASRIMSVAQRGGPFKVNRDAMLGAIDGHVRPNCAEKMLDAIEEVLRPYIDAAESVAASALSQDETRGN